MFHFIKRFGLAIAVMVAGGQSIFGYALLGPFNEPFQVSLIGYHLGGDIGGPKNFREGYRWNTPTNYYAYDQTFLNYFQTNGTAAVDAAFDVFNNLTNISQMNLDDYPTVASRLNYRAQALNLVDLKSVTMSLLIEQLGLAEPDRWTWCLADRYPVPGASCPIYDFLVIQRNYDPYTGTYSPYVNGILYDYDIVEVCPPVPDPQADAYEVLVDPTQAASAYSAVASFGPQGYNYGSFYLGLTRDDIGGLKALYSATNMYAEAAESNSVVVVTNTQVSILNTFNLAIFQSQARTNNAAALTALYPGLAVIDGTNSTWFTNVVTTNVTGYLTNPPFAPAGTVQLILVTNYTTNFQLIYNHTFANVVVLHAYPQTKVAQQTISFGPIPLAPAGTYGFITNTTVKLQNFTNGDFYILPTNACGPYEIISSLQNVAPQTNFIPLATNGIITNSSSTIILSDATINYFTNYQYAVHSVDCSTNLADIATMRQGMDHIYFQRVGYDFIRHQLVTPITNYYQLVATNGNGGLMTQTLRRIITQPDFLITAQNLEPDNGSIPAVPLAKRAEPLYNVSMVPPATGGEGQPNGGPGTMQPTGRTLTFNSVGPIYLNTSFPSFLPFGAFSGVFFLPSGAYYFMTNSAYVFQWGSFDGTTNAPVVYPASADIGNLESQLLFGIVTSMLPDASISTNTPASPYSYQLLTAGGSYSQFQPLRWKLTDNSPGLPPGLSLSSDGVISGVPTSAGTYDFTVQVTDATGLVAQKDLFLNVDF